MPYVWDGDKFIYEPDNKDWSLGPNGFEHTQGWSLGHVGPGTMKYEMERDRPAAQNVRDYVAKKYNIEDREGDWMPDAEGAPVEAKPAETFPEPTVTPDQDTTEARNALQEQITPRTSSISDAVRSHILTKQQGYESTLKDARRLSSAGDAMVRIGQSLANIGPGSYGAVELESSGPTAQVQDLEDQMTPNEKQMIKDTLGIDVPEGLSFSRFKTMFPQIAGYFRSKEAAKAESEDRQAALDIRKQSMENLQEERAQRKEQRDLLMGRMPDKEVERLRDIDNTLGAVDVLDQKVTQDPSLIGPVVGRLNPLLKKMGLDNPERSVAAAEAQALLVNWMKQISGVAISEQEARRLMETMANTTQTPETFHALLKSFKDRMNRDYANTLKFFKQQGRNVAPFEKPGMNLEEGPVTLVSPDGKEEIQVSPDQVEYYVSKGAKVKGK